MLRLKIPPNFSPFPERSTSSSACSCLLPLSYFMGAMIVQFTAHLERS